MKYVLLLMALSLSLCSIGQERVTHAFVCPGDTVGLIAFSDSADLYEWYMDGEYMTSTTSNTVEVYSLGVYSVMAYNINGCKSDLSNAFVVEKDSLHAEGDTASLHFTDNITIPIINNDKRGCYDLDMRSIQIVNGPWHGRAIINRDGTVEYIPKTRASNVDQFIYTVTDMDHNVSNPALVTIWVGNECGVVFPNPTYDNVKIRTRNKEVRFVRVCDMSGRILQTEQMEAGEKVVSVLYYPDGIYALQLMNKMGKAICTYKIEKRSN